MAFVLKHLQITPASVILNRLVITKNFSVPPSRQAAKACTSYDRNSSRSTTSSSITTPKRASQSPKRHSACADAQDLNPNAIRRHLSRHLRNSFPASPTWWSAMYSYSSSVSFFSVPTISSQSVSLRTRFAFWGFRCSVAGVWLEISSNLTFSKIFCPTDFDFTCSFIFGHFQKNKIFFKSNSHINGFKLINLRSWISSYIHYAWAPVIKSFLCSSSYAL